MATLNRRTIDVAADFWDSVREFDNPVYPEYRRGQVELIVQLSLDGGSEDPDTVTAQVEAAIRLRLALAEAEDAYQRVIAGR